MVCAIFLHSICQEVSEIIFKITMYQIPTDSQVALSGYLGGLIKVNDISFLIKMLVAVKTT